MMSGLEEALLLWLDGQDQSKSSMGQIVTRFVQDGHEIAAVEQAIWRLLVQRKLTPAGYVRRTISRKNPSGEADSVLAYDFVLVPWSPELDKQLELKLYPGAEQGQ